MKLTLTQGLLGLLVATQIPVAIHYGRPLVDEIRREALLKQEEDNRKRANAERWKRVLKLAEVHCTEAAIGKPFNEQETLMGPVSFGPPESRAACLKRMEFLTDNPNYMP